MKLRFLCIKLSPAVSLLSTTALASILSLVAPVQAQSQVFRCAGVAGAATEYINNVIEAQSRGCKRMEGGNVSVLQGAPVPKASPAPAKVAATGSTPSGSAEQKSRDSDMRVILETELKRSETRLLEQQKEYNNGQPEKQGIEGRNYQRYLDRVTQLKEAITRSQSDIAGIKRELARLPGTGG
jgi:hypothetical protein